MMEELTEHEKIIIDLVQQGLTNSKITVKTGINPTKVSSYLRSIKDKLGVNTKMDIINMKRLTHITIVDKEPHKLQPGEAMYSELHHAWLIGCPNPQCSPDPILHGIANLVAHDVTEDNGVITVSPSILHGCGAHFFVEQNNIRWC